MLVTRVRFWILAVVLFLYLAAVFVLSIVNTVKRTQLKRFDYGGSGLKAPLKKSKIEWCSELGFVVPPRTPVALASFPGSGNTWLRYLIQQATGYYTGSVYRDYGLLRNGFPAENVSNGSVIVVKTHEWGQFAKTKFSKAILLVRKPAKAIQAEFNRQSGGHIGFASPERYRSTHGKHWKKFVSEKLTGWQATNLYWLYNFTGPTHVIFYEQLVENTEHTLRSIIEFIELPVDESQLMCTLERKEGIYRRKKRVLKFDPFSESMKVRIAEVQRKVYDAIYSFAMPSSS